MGLQTYSYHGVPISYSEKYTALKEFLTTEKYSNYFIITDNNVRKQCLPLVKKEIKLFSKAEIISIKPGEKNKNWKSVEYILTELTNENADRKSLIINLGGGMISDIGGFAAAIYKRGIDYINIPTSLLGMVDAAIGSKTGINFQDFKNQIGVIKHPKAIFICPELLETLPFKEMVNGMAESIKHALTDSQQHLDLIFKHFDAYQFEQIIKASVKFKTKIVSTDLYEQNERKILNFGHTVGHAIESYLLKEKYDVKHGECIAYGMVAEMQLSKMVLKVDDTDWSKSYELMRKIFPVLDIDKSGVKKILSLMKNDKKNLKNEYRFTLLQKVGEPIMNVHASDKLIEQAIKEAIEIMKI